MARKNTKKKKNEPKKNEPKKSFAKPLLFLAFFIVLLTASYLFLRNSHYFKITAIEVIDRSNAADVDVGSFSRLYMGRSIFDVDIDSLSSRIKTEYPVIKEAVVKRVLPDCLQIDIIPRIPVAKIKAREYFPIDRAGMVLSPEIKCGKLPIITGLSSWRKPKVGEKMRDKGLANTFLLLDAFKESSVLEDYSVATIDASNYRNLSFYLEDGIEVKIGGEDFSKRLKKFKTTLANPDLDKRNIKYIDLRFRDVVIGPK